MVEGGGVEGGGMGRGWWHGWGGWRERVWKDKELEPVPCRQNRISDFTRLGTLWGSRMVSSGCTER